MYQFRLLGPVQVQRAGKAVWGFESRKALALLCYLAARGQPLSRDHLTDLFWGDKAPERARANLSRVLHNLNSVVPDCLAADRHTVELATGPEIWIDVAVFDALANQGTLPALNAATELYRGEFMADVFLDDCPDAELWLVGQRERWRGRVAELQYDLMSYHAGHGALAEALRHAERLLDLEPWREETHRQAMLLLARRGERAAALARFEACRSVLTAEFGVEPSPETVALYEQIRAGEIEADAAPPTLVTPEPPTNLPVALTDFVGREDELALLATRLADPACRLLTLVGPGGCGKTRLALEAARAARATFPDGVWWVRLEAVASPDLIPTAIADALGLKLAGHAPPETQLRAHLQDRCLLLVLDNFEHLLTGAEAVLDILRATTLVKVLVTSRQRLDFQAEWLVPVRGLAYPKNDMAMSVAAAQASPAVQLFVTRARHVAPGLAPDDALWRCAARLCRLVQGLPLAIELAASQIGDMACEHIAAEVERGLDVLVTTSRDVPVRHRSLWAVFEQSWGLLSAPEQAVFAAVSVFRGGFTDDAAAQVAGATPAVLHGLRTKFFLSSGAAERFEVHAQLRQFGEEKLALGSSPQGQVDAEALAGTAMPEMHSDWTSDAVHRRHASFYLALAEAAEPWLDGPDQAIWLDRLAGEHDNLGAALEWAARSGAAVPGLRLAGSLAHYWEMRGRFQEGRRHLAVLLALPKADAPGAIRAKALAAFGALAEEQGDYPVARAAHEESLAIRRALGDQAGIAECLNNLGNVADFQGDYAAARALYEESLVIRRVLGDPWPIASTLNNLGNVAMLQGDYAAARPLYAESLTLFRAIGGPWAIAVTLNNLGLVAAELGNFTAARPLLEESLSIARQIDDRQGIADALQNLGDIACRQGELAATRTIHAESLGLRRDLGNQQGLAASLESIASLARAEGDAARAARLLGAAATLREAIHAPRSANEQPELEAEIDALRAILGADGFAAAWAVGEALGTDDAVALALATPGEDPAPEEFAKT